MAEERKIIGDVRVQGPFALRDFIAAAALTGLLNRHGAPKDDEGPMSVGRQCYDEEEGTRPLLGANPRREALGLQREQGS